MIALKLIFFSCFFLAIYGAGLLRTPSKCTLMDFECQKEMFKEILIHAADGDEESNIPSVSPIKLNNIVYTLPKNVRLIMNSGVVTGVKDCKVVEVDACFKQPSLSTLDIMCDLEVNGRYSVEFPKCTIKQIGGEDTGLSFIRGCGKGKVTIKNLHLKLNVPFNMEAKDDDIYIKVECLKVVHDENDKIDFTINELNVGNELNNEKIKKYLEEHSTEMDFITPVTDKMEEFFKAIVFNYITQVPARSLFNDDVARYTN